MAKTDRPDELTAYVNFQREVAAGLAEAERLDDAEPAFIPYGRCPRHPDVFTFERGFDVPCYRCEAEMDEDAYADDTWEEHRGER
jgi:hypothetical protein